MESNLKSSLSESLTYKNEVKSIMSIQQGSNYGFILEIESQFGTFYAPVKAYKSREYALQYLRRTLK